jgi:hypothetical protein
LDHIAKNKLDLSRLRARLGEKPRTKAGQIRQAWPDIRALFEAGHSLRDIWTWLNEIGIDIGYARLSDYISQMRRRDQAAALAEPSPAISDSRRASDPAAPVSPNSALAPAPNDPLSNIRERQNRSSGFQYNSEPDVTKLI